MTATLTISSKLSPFPYGPIAIASYTQKAEILFDESTKTAVLELNGSRISSDDEIVHAIAKAGGLSEDSAKTQSYFALAQSLSLLAAIPEVVAALDSLDDHLAFRTFLVGYDITAADWIVWGALKGNMKLNGLLRNNGHPHLHRWFTYLETLDSTQAALASFTAAKANKARSTKSAAGFALGLQNAKENQVVTRFPPEPSGYLHIGHAKAAMLNQYFAKMYKGKLVIRFDDTNPTKERAEFEDTILEDLKLIDVQGDQFTHTSDYFDELFDLAIKLIKSGKAYTDDTEQIQMRDERGKGIASAHRDDSIEDNLKHFAEMKEGSQEGLRWCLRAKISIDNPNKALRDPVIYRCNIIAHHRTGDKWKVYPTYDFACPIVDSIEGITHALRTNEYRDRNPQYQWMIEALQLRQVNIWDFSRLNFIYTLLSKRKLRWFVDTGLVRGWDDPRFPTVRGIRRRGLTVEALSQFMLLQGPSQAIVSLEWDSIWALNKKVIDPIAPRHWAILRDKQVVVTLTGGPTDVEVKVLPKHKKNAAIGEKTTVYTSTVIIEQEDAVSFDDQEEITLMDWGNAVLRSKTVGPSGDITAMEMELNLVGDFRKTKKKITWLAQPTPAHPLIDVTLIDYDYLITKKKLEETDNVEDFVTPVTEFREEALADANVRDVKKGDIIQFERKAFFVFDGETDGKLEFIKIPDGKAASLASKAGNSVPAASTSADPRETASGKNGGKPAVALQPGFDIPVSTKMYEAAKVYEVDLKPPADTKMYGFRSIYDS